VLQVLKHCLTKGYKKLSLIGFSLGGNLVLKAITELDTKLIAHFTGGVGVSVPIYLSTSGRRMEEKKNWVYNNRFILRMRKKFKIKEHLMDPVLFAKLMQLQRIRDVDEYFTAPQFGFRNAEDYYNKVSGNHILNALKAPVLIINAKNDSFLAPDAYPVQIAKKNEFFYLMMPKKGGHCGFKQKGTVYFHEQEAVKFLNQMAKK